MLETAHKQNQSIGKMLEKKLVECGVKNPQEQYKKVHDIVFKEAKAARSQDVQKVD